MKYGPTIWSHLLLLPPHLIPIQCTLYFAVNIQMLIVGDSIQGASGTFLRVHGPQVVDCNIDHSIVEYLTMACFI